MSVFTKIGKAVKKGTKQISLKNLVKVGTPFLSMIPLVGGGLQTTVQGLSDASAMKKQAREQNDMQMALEAQVKAQEASKVFNETMPSIGSAFVKKTVEGLYDKVSDDVKTNVAKVGADMTDLTISAWLKKHLTALLISGGVLIAGVVYWMSKPKRRTAVRRTSYRR